MAGESMLIKFQGLTFYEDSDKSVPIEIIEQPDDDGRIITDNLLDLLNRLKAEGILDKRRKGHIVIADDQFIN